MSYPFPGLFAIDPENPSNVAVQANVTIFDPSDPSKEAIALTDSSGLPLPNPLTTNAKGFIGSFRAEIDEVGWRAGGLEGLERSFAGIRQLALDARSDAADASRAAIEAKTAAEDAASLVEAPADTVVAKMLAEDTETRRAADSRYQQRGEDRVLVTDFGAVGDNETNNDDAFGAAITYALGTFGQGGKTVVFPAGDYVTRQRIELLGNLQYEAYGATFRKPDVSAGYAVFYTRSMGSTGYGSGASNIVWRGGTFKGDFSVDNMICPFALHHSDNVQFDDVTCIETQGIGHTFDLNGCSNIRVDNLEVFGFKNTSTGGYAKSECIQIDVSAAGVGSAPDEPGSYDGLMTRDVVVSRSKFRSITSNGVFYPAPNPLGSHAQYEGSIPTNIRLERSIVENPYQDVTSNVRGVVHFVGGNNIELLDNLIFYTADSPTRSTTLFGFYSTNWGVPKATAKYNDPANASAELADPLMVRGVRIKGNRVWGVQATTQEHLVKFLDKSDATSPVGAKDVLFESNSFTIDGGSSALNVFHFRNMEDVYFKGKNSVIGPARAVQGTDTKNVTLEYIYTSGNRNDAVRFDNFSGLTILSVQQKASAGSSLYLSAGTDLAMQNIDVESLGGGKAIAINGVSRFNITSVTPTCPSGMTGVDIYGGSAHGFVNGVIASGGTQTPVNNLSESVVVFNAIAV